MPAQLRSHSPCRFIIASFVALATGGIASAADISMFVKAPPAPVAAPWQGFYIGAHAGYGWSKKTFVDNFPVFDGDIDADANVNGGLGGFQGGYNYQLDWLVLGIEGEFTWSGIGNTSFSCFSFGDQICSAKPEWFADVTGRLGIADGPFLFYGKGGIVWVHDRYTNLATCAGSQPRSSGGINAACGDEFIADETRRGWLAGGGIEYLFAPAWSLKVEYNYMDLGAQSVSFFDGAGGFFTEEIHQTIQSVKAGLNYHFAAAPTPARTSLFIKASPQAAPGKNVIGFTGFDAAKYSYSGWAGGLMAPFGNLDNSGFRLLMLGEGGWSKYPAGDKFIRDIMSGGELLAGYGFVGDTYTFNVFIGPNAINHMLSDIDNENSVQGTAFGAKAHADLRVNPTAQTLIFSEGEYSTAFRTYYATVKLGYEIAKGTGLFIGPEAGALGDERSDQWRVGGHLSEWKIGEVTVDISAGYAHDSSVGASAYGHVELSKEF